MRFGRRRGAGPPGARLLLAAVALLPARATPQEESPPPSEEETARERNAYLIDNALHSCSGDAIDSGTFELIEIAVPYDGGRRVTPTIKSRRSSMGRPLYWCVERALAKVRLHPAPSSYTQVFALGDLPPLPLDFLRAWQRAVPDPARVRRALSGWLQPEVEVTAAGCLHVAGPEVLAAPFLEWRPEPGGPWLGLYNGEQVYPLPADWWLHRHTRHFDAGDERTAHDVDEEFCLDHVDPAVSALLRGDSRLQLVANHNATFDAEWVVDSVGRQDGDIGFCLVPGNMSYTPDEAAQVRRQVEGLLRGLEYGHAKGSRLIRIRYDHAAGLTVRGVWPAQFPVQLAYSAVEKKCDHRAALRCERTDETRWPSLESVAPLRKCVRETGVNDQVIDASFDVTPDGAVANLQIGPWNTPVPACVRAALAGLVFPRSEGGSCSQSARLHEILWLRPNRY